MYKHKPILFKTIALIRQYFKIFINEIIPPRCISCKIITQDDTSFCSKCWEKIDFISNPQCHICSEPFELSVEKEVICPNCIKTRPLYNMARSALAYNENSRNMIIEFKYYNKTHTVDIFAKWMMINGQEVIENSDIIVPVPLHKMRILKRRYNQSALLANALGRLSKLPVRIDLLSRIKNTPPQSELSFNSRKNNVSNAFKTNKKKCADIEGKNICLVDDVMTTGATVESCARVMLEAGAKNVNVLTIGKTIKR